jgi:uncharacterized protein
MLIRFVVSNFLSFKEETEFNMLTGSFKIHNQHVHSHNGIEVLKGAAIYGANGAGKSNLIKAVAFLQTNILAEKLDFRSMKHKASKDFLSKPTSFEIEFISNDSTFSYGVVLDHTKVLEEWLVKINANKKDETIFERKIEGGKQTLELNQRYLITDEDKYRRNMFANELLKDNALFLNFVANLKENKIIEIAQAYRWFWEKLIIVFPKYKPVQMVPNFVLGRKFHAFSNRLICGAATGITKIDVKTIPIEEYFGKDDAAGAADVTKRLNGGEAIVTVGDNPFVENAVAVLENGKPVVKKLFTWHNGHEGHQVEFDLLEESDGTQRLLDFLPAIYALLNSDNVVVFIDEIDQSIHASLLKSLVKKIMNENKTSSQLIFTTHESNLLDLDIFRQDEVWFVEKDEAGATHLYSLSDFKPRFDLDVRKGYLNGRFGAIPFLGNLVDLKWEEYAEEGQGV